jgi:hypothetical protein
VTRATLSSMGFLLIVNFQSSYLCAGDLGMCILCHVYILYIELNIWG